MVEEVDRIELIGTVEQFGPNLECSVRLDSGELVPARIPKRVARMMWRVVPGDRVRLKLLEPGDHVVLGHYRVHG